MRAGPRAGSGRPGPRPAARHASYGDLGPAVVTAAPNGVVPEYPAADDRSPRRAARADVPGAHVHVTDGPGLHRTVAPRQRSGRASALSAVAEVVVVVGLALLLALVVKTLLVQAFYIPSESMERTLLVGDRVLVSKLTPGPFDLERGDVVVFRDPGGWLQPSEPAQDGAVRHVLRAALTFVGLLPQDSGEHLIKRVIGLPGDRVACCDAQGRLTVNGAPLDEVYLAPGIEPSSIRFMVTVPSGRLWVMGDNRPFSEDSRFHTNLEGGGTVPVEDVVGEAVVVVWPVGRAGGFGAPDSVFARVPAGGARR